MADFIELERIMLKTNPDINEKQIQEYIFNNPSVLGLGELSPIQREKIQPAGGRLDVLLADDNGTRYEVEIQLGSTDPSHIIRTIEYWDSERKRYPQYDHCAVIVAEEITGRFMNVISLFNGSIPLIALQLSAYKVNNGVALIFASILDRVTYASEEDEQSEVTDREYWERKSNSNILREMDRIFADLKTIIGGYELNYTKFYIGMQKDGISKNFLMFRPMKSSMDIVFKGTEDNELIQEATNYGLDLTFKPRLKEYYLRVNRYSDYNKEGNKGFIEKCISNSMEYFNISAE